MPITPQCLEAGKEHRFQPGNTEQKKGRPWSIRDALRNLAAQDIDPDDFEEGLNALLREEGKCTVARLAAARMLARSIKKAEPLMMEKVIENIEGKLPQDINMGDQRTAPTEFTSPEEAAAAYGEFIKG